MANEGQRREGKQKRFHFGPPYPYRTAPRMMVIPRHAITYPRPNIAVLSLPADQRGMRSKRRRPDDLPVMPPIRGSDVFRIERLIGALQPLRLLEKPARSGRDIKKQYPPGLSAAHFPSMSEPARIKAQLPGLPTVTSSPILKVISPAST